MCVSLYNLEASMRLRELHTHANICIIMSGMQLLRSRLHPHSITITNMYNVYVHVIFRPACGQVNAEDSGTITAHCSTFHLVFIVYCIAYICKFVFVEPSCRSNWPITMENPYKLTNVSCGVVTVEIYS